MDICHLPKNAEVELLQGDSVKDDSGAMQHLLNWDLIRPQMTTGKVMDVIARQPVASAYTQVQQIAPRLFIIPKSGCPDIWIRLPKHR